MKNTIMITLFGALLTVGVAQTNAGTTVVKTNYDAAIGIKLTAYTPEGTVAIATKDVINALTGSMVGTTTLPTFTASAKLVYRQSGTTNPIPVPGVYILDGANSYYLGDLIARTKNTSVGITSGSSTTTYSYDTFTVQGKIPFTVSGVSTTTTNSPSKDVVVLKSLTAPVAGTEEITNVVSGTITVSGGKLE
jgi:hypothetical protein